MAATFWTALALVGIGGMALAVQAPINAALGRSVGDGVIAAMISFGTGFLLLLALAASRGVLPSLATLKAVPWWCWTGGIFGAFYVWAVLWSVPKLGVVTTFAVLILGQLLAALFLDANGAFGLPIKEITIPRVGAVALVSAGLVISRF
ncbi:DMT family transporter [Pelagibius litoralis]|uniref:DMT family transporter n=1 Tax=Pelagibius litoralis TaxID=374515 RepID=A0A967CCM1_9PROT|nr:DMT family transporter [Pelagibius litoralis]NIA69163.1 DMT family transporter [Pelagibius litoralis]